MCAHGGQVTVIPKQAQVLAGGMPVLRAGDLEGSPILGCAQPPTPATVPCTVVASVFPIPGASTSLFAKALGMPLLLQTLTGLTNGVPPSPLVVVSPGQTKVIA